MVRVAPSPKSMLCVRLLIPTDRQCGIRSIPHCSSVVATDSGPSAPAGRDRQLVKVDRLIELYCDWRCECAHVRTTYARFAMAGASDRRRAFATYSAALDREGSAADAYQAQISAITSRAGAVALTEEMRRDHLGVSDRSGRRSAATGQRNVGTSPAAHDLMASAPNREATPLRRRRPLWPRAP